MGGRGVYFTTISPGKKVDGASWPSVKFREDLLKSNYGDDWNNLSRQQLVDAVIVCFVDQGICVPVPPWLRGRLCPERCRSAERIRVCQAQAADAVARRLKRRCQAGNRRESCAPNIFTMPRSLWSTAQSSCTQLS